MKNDKEFNCLLHGGNPLTPIPSEFLPHPTITVTHPTNMASGFNFSAVLPDFENAFKSTFGGLLGTKINWQDVTLVGGLLILWVIWFMYYNFFR